jgi:predicted nucleic acid-binding protein
MRVLFDTSVLVAGLVETHPMHPLAFPWLERAKAGEIELLVSTHTLAELFAVLTTLPLRPRLSPTIARQLIDGVVEASAAQVELSVADYNGVISRMAALGLAGGTVYDALIAWAAKKSGVDHLLTLNERHFRRVWPEGRGLILSPVLSDSRPDWTFPENA